jgi:hypothetical protein
MGVNALLIDPARRVLWQKRVRVMPAAVLDA